MVYNVNAPYLTHALLSECLFSSACAILSRRRRNSFVAHALPSEKIGFIACPIIWNFSFWNKIYEKKF